MSNEVDQGPLVVVRGLGWVYQWPGLVISSLDGSISDLKWSSVALGGSISGLGWSSVAYVGQSVV